jgi:hypothetical protein
MLSKRPAQRSGRKRGQRVDFGRSEARSQLERAGRPGIGLQSLRYFLPAGEAPQQLAPEERVFDQQNILGIDCRVLYESPERSRYPEWIAAWFVDGLLHRARLHSAVCYATQILPMHYERPARVSERSQEYGSMEVSN